MTATATAKIATGTIVTANQWISGRPVGIRRGVVIGSVCGDAIVWFYTTGDTDAVAAYDPRLIEVLVRHYDVTDHMLNRWFRLANKAPGNDMYAFAEAMAARLGSRRSARLRAEAAAR